MDEIINFFEHYFSAYETDKNPVAGQILGLLIQEPEPISLNDIANKLNLSKAAISIQIRSLSSSGYCFKLPRKSDRKDYYRVNEHFIIQVIEKRLRNHDMFMEELNRILLKTSDKNTVLRLRLEHFYDSLKIIKKLHYDTINSLRRNLDLK